jgi:hypothetical protein
MVSPDARPYLQQAANTDKKSLVKTTLELRKELGPPRTHLVIAQAELRRRAAVKFRRAEEMFFTRQLLEQATDERVAAYKAARFSPDVQVIDLCCGVGGDLMAFADRGPVIAVDRDPIATILAEANCRVNGLENVDFRLDDVSEQNLEGFAAWHLDPDRRSDGKRSIRLENHDPGPEAIEQFLAGNGNAAVKLAPASRLREEWAEFAEVEWIGNRGECKQQVLWFNALARYPGQRAATVLQPGNAPPYTIHGLPAKNLPVAETLGRYVYEPHAAVLAAHLAGILSEQHDLPCVSPKIPYLTSDRLVSDPALACFEVEEVLPVDPKHMKSAIRERRIGNLEVKKRGVRIDPEDVRKQINPRGDESGTLIILPVNKKTSALLAHRVTPPAG